MEELELKVLIQRFLHLVSDDPSPSEERLTALAALLDHLSLAYFRVRDGASVGTLEAPSRDYEAMRRVVAQRFPEFGFYPCVGPGDDPPEIMYGDAVDDLSDIALDLTDVLWLWENDSGDEAIWQYKLLYRMHFGRHMQDLRSYLHWKLWE